jgi:CHAD domain-containing protein
MGPHPSDSAPTRGVDASFGIMPPLLVTSPSHWPLSMPQPSRFCLSPAEPVSEGFRRIVLEKIADADQQLTDLSVPLDERVHAARKRFKEIRATLRLARHLLGDRQFALENRWFRDAARSLAPLRDAQAALESFEKFSPFLQKQAGRSATRSLGRLLRSHAAALPPRDELDTVFDEVRARLAIARRRAVQWKFERDSFELIAPGVKTIYAAARSKLRGLTHDSSETAVHEWRKRVKDHWYHTTILVHAWSEEFAQRIEQLDDLSHVLGDHHDLAVIRQSIEEHVTEFRGEAAVVRLLEAITTRQQQLEKDARELGSRIFSMRPGRFSTVASEGWNFTVEEAQLEAEARTLRPTG